MSEEGESETEDAAEGGEGEAEQPGTIGKMVDSTGVPFVVAALLVPIVLAGVAVAVGNVRLLNLVHVISGATWAGATVLVAGVLGPSLNRVDPEARSDINLVLIPKNTFLFSGVAAATVLTGPVMVTQVSYLSFSNAYVSAALGIAALLVLGAAYLVYLQAQIYNEFTSPGKPDIERVQALAGNLQKVSPAMLALQLLILVVMTLMRSSALA